MYYYIRLKRYDSLLHTGQVKEQGWELHRYCRLRNVSRTASPRPDGCFSRILDTPPPGSDTHTPPRAPRPHAIPPTDRPPSPTSGWNQVVAFHRRRFHQPVRPVFAGCTWLAVGSDEGAAAQAAERERAHAKGQGAVGGDRVDNA